MLNSKLLESKKDFNIESLVSINITVVVAIAKAIVVIVRGEFCGGLWLHPLPQNLFPAGACVQVLYCTRTLKFDIGEP